MAIANVALTDTFDVWRIRTNQIIVSIDGVEVRTNAAFTQANTARTTANAGYTTANAGYTTANAAFVTANAANSTASSALQNTSGTLAGTLTITNGLTISNGLNVSSGTVTTARANIVSQVLTDAATISWNTSLGQIATVTLGGSRIMGAPTNLRVGTYILNVIQDGSGNRTLTWNSVFKWSAGVAPPLSTAAGARDIFTFFSDGTNLYGSFIPDVR